MTQTFLQLPDHAGCLYVEFLSRLHTYLKPKTYFEIGTLNGHTLALSKCDSIAVDPSFRLEVDIATGKSVCLLFQMTSDDFFAKYNPQVLLRSTIDMAFLDGMHWFEFLLRDLVNVEAHCRNNSVILLHDCIPTDSYVARRDHGDKSHLAETSHSEWWAGDCWKAVAIIKQYRPDLEIHCFDAPPTGIIAITNLDPTSRVLKDRYFEATREFRETSSSENLESYIRSLQIRHTEDYRTAAAISSLFWI